MENKILYELVDGTTIYKGEKPPTNKELHKAPESYSLKELNNMSPSRLRELNKDFSDDN